MKDARKAALMTGGGQGIGNAVALRLLQEGWMVALLDLDTEAGEEAAQDFASRFRQPPTTSSTAG